MYRKNTAGQFICVQLILTATGAVATGLTPAARRCIDGSFAAGTGTYTEDGTTGAYKYALSQADTNGNDISIITTATGAIPVCVNFVTTAADPTNATTFGITDIDAAISSRMATYTQPTGFLAATFPSGTVANQTNITGGTITTVTNLTNAPTAGDLTAAMKTSVATAVWTDITAGDFTVAASIGKSVLNGVALGTGLTINAYTGDTPQTGDSFARIGAAGAGLTNLGDTRIANLDAAVSSRMATFTLPANFSALAISAGGHISNVDTLTTYTGNTPQTGDAFARLGAPAGASVSADIAEIEGETDTLLAGVNTTQINGVALAAQALSQSASSLCWGTCSGGTVSTAVVSTLNNPGSLTDAGQLIGRTIIFLGNTTTINMQSQASSITASTTGATPTITFTAMTHAPANGDVFVVF